MDSSLAILAILAVLGFRVMLYFYDVGKIKRAADMKGWRDARVSWAPFAPGWLFEKGERNYLVTYHDQRHDQREVYCKVSLLTGVYWRDDNQIR